MTEDDFHSKAEAEMKLHDAKMMEQAKLRKLSTASLQERISFAMKKTENDAEAALIYLKDNHLIHDGEKVNIEMIEKSVGK